MLCNVQHTPQSSADWIIIAAHYKQHGCVSSSSDIGDARKDLAGSNTGEVMRYDTG